MCVFHSLQEERIETDKLQQLYQATAGLESGTNLTSDLKINSQRRQSLRMSATQKPQSSQNHQSSRKRPNKSPHTTKKGATNQPNQRPKRKRSSGLWGTIIDSFVVPTKKFMFGK